MTPKQWRERNNYSVAEAAAAIQTDRASWNNYERGKPVDTRRLAERFSAATDGLVSIEEWMFPYGVPARVTLTALDAKARE